jgi:Tol biopolymer transport system component
MNVCSQGATFIVNTSSQGVQANGHSGAPMMSEDGRYVAFYSQATNLLPGLSGLQNVFLKDIVTGVIDVIGISSTGVLADGGCYSSGLPSSDGRYVAFSCTATNLVPGDTNGQPDSFMRDRVLGTTRRISVSTFGVQGNAQTFAYDMTPNSRLIVMTTLASNLFPNDTNNTWDCILHDILTGETTLESVNAAGQQANGRTQSGFISVDGRFVAFGSQATNLVANDTNGRTDAFVRDRLTGLVERVSTDATGAQVNGNTDMLDFSGSGRYVLLRSDAPDLVAGDNNGISDIFVKDLNTGIVTIESVSSTGVQADGGVIQGTISADGRFVAFSSLANNLVPNDTNPGTDLFLRDRLLGTTVLLTVDSGGVQGAIPCAINPSTPCGGQYLGVAISLDGRMIAHDHTGGALVPGGDANGLQRDIFINDWTHVVTAITAPQVGQTMNLQFSALLDPGATYIGALSADYSPGIPLGVRRVPLEPDALFLASFFLQLPGMTGWSGTLDFTGRALASVQVPALPSLAGITIRAAFLTLDPANPGLARGISNAVPLTILP